MDVGREFGPSETVWFIERNKKMLVDCISVRLLGAREEAPVDGRKAY